MVIFNSYVSLPEGNAVLVKKGISLVEKKNYWCVLRREWMGWEWGCWDDDITSDDWDHSQKFPAI